MKKLKSILLVLGLTAFGNLVNAQGTSYLHFSDTSLRITECYMNDNEWLIVTKNHRALFFDDINKETQNLDGYKWKYTLSVSEYNQKVWMDNDYIYFENKKDIERVAKKTGNLVDRIALTGLTNAPHSNGKFIYLIMDYKGKNSQVCYNPKRKKVVWAVETYKNFASPVYTDRFIITRDNTNSPIAISYEDGTPKMPAVYEGGCPFRSWLDMFTQHGNDLNDSIFYYDGYIYSVNFYFGFFSKYETDNYPVPLVTLDMNKFTRKEKFSFTRIPQGSMFYSNRGIQFVTDEELDSLSKTKRKGSMGTYMPCIPISKPQYYKVKSTTKLGNFDDFMTSRFVAFTEGRYFVFEKNGQMIGISPIGARTYNFPNIYISPEVYSVFDNVIYYRLPNSGGINRLEIERIITEEEYKAMQPSPEFLEMIEQMKREQQEEDARNQGKQ